MRRALAAALAVGSLGLGAAFVGPAVGVAIADPQYVDRVEWVEWGGRGDLASLRIYPTPAARAAAAQLGTTAQGDRAWAEVLALSPQADLPGMREQFRCHWQLAEFAEPGKTSWNLEPWRPRVEYPDMIAAGCNPGAAEEPF